MHGILWQITDSYKIMAIRDCQNECAFNFPGNVNEDLADMMYFSSVYVCCRLKLIVLTACFKSFHFLCILMMTTMMMMTILMYLPLPLHLNLSYLCFSCSSLVHFARLLLINVFSFLQSHNIRIPTGRGKREKVRENANSPAKSGISREL